MRVLVVTGDDFGRSKAVNRGIAEAHDRGLLTSASLMVAGDAAAEAIALARTRPALSVGLHLTLADGRSVLPPSDIPHIVDAVGQFRPRPFTAGVHYQFSAAARRELRREIRAQLARYRESGLALAHVDGHHHLHLHPVVLGILMDLAGDFSIPSLRLPSEELLLALALDRRRRVSKVLWRAVFALLRRHARPRLEKKGIAFCERVYGLLATGRVTEEYLLRLIPRIQADRVEIYCHPASRLPGEGSGVVDAAGPSELAALLSSRVAATAARSGFLRRQPSADSSASTF